MSDRYGVGWLLVNQKKEERRQSERRRKKERRQEATGDVAYYHIEGNFTQAALLSGRLFLLLVWGGPRTFPSTNKD